jgi:uncharacterized alkaline shock family protein YloU
MNTAQRLHALISGIDGVAVLYPADPLWRRVAAGIAGTLPGESPGSPPAVDVATGGDGIRVRVRVGVHSGSPAPDLIRRIAQTIRDDLELHAGGDPIAEVSVQIVSFSHAQATLSGNHLA